MMAPVWQMERELEIPEWAHGSPRALNVDIKRDYKTGKFPSFSLN